MSDARKTRKEAIEEHTVYFLHATFSMLIYFFGFTDFLILSFISSAVIFSYITSFQVRA